MVSDNILQPEEHVLSTLEKDGSRRWLKPKLSKGKLLNLRRALAYLLIVVFTVMPFLKIGGEPVLLLDVIGRRFTVLGFTFLPTDFGLLAILAVGGLLTVFLFTALFGRVWCGWGCPQTVYMEFVFRPIERFFDGTAGRGGKARKLQPWRTLAKYFVYFLVCVYLANTFLAYFIGVERLGAWVQQSPLQHPQPFLVMAAVTFAMMVDFCFFREQMCLIACPYGRFQSVLLDKNSLIVSYDRQRGENRGRKPKEPVGEGLPVIGDCVDCGNCVTTCPTGIDIRDGLQMECINCTQCIDACNIVMNKMGRAPDLIRYSSESRDAGGRPGLLRARTLIYPVLLTAIGTAFIFALMSVKTFDAFMVREPGNPFSYTDEGQVRNLFNLKITNRSEKMMTFTATIQNPSGAVFELREKEFTVESDESRGFHLGLIVPRETFINGLSKATILLESDDGARRSLEFELVGPYD